MQSVFRELMHQPGRRFADLCAVGVGALHAQADRREPFCGEADLLLDDVVLLIQVRTSGLQRFSKVLDDLPKRVLVDPVLLPREVSQPLRGQCKFRLPLGQQVVGAGVLEQLPEVAQLPFQIFFPAGGFFLRLRQVLLGARILGMVRMGALQAGQLTHFACPGRQRFIGFRAGLGAFLNHDFLIKLLGRQLLVRRIAKFVTRRGLKPGPRGGFASLGQCSIKVFADLQALFDFLLDPPDQEVDPLEGLHELLEPGNVGGPVLQNILAHDLVHRLGKAHAQRKAEGARKRVVRCRTGLATQHEQHLLDVARAIVEQRFLTGDFGLLQQPVAETAPGQGHGFPVHRLQVLGHAQLNAADHVAPKHLLRLVAQRSLNAHAHRDRLIGLGVAPDQRDVGCGLLPCALFDGVAILTEAVRAQGSALLVRFVVGLGIEVHLVLVGAHHGDLHRIERRTLAAAIAAEQTGDFFQAEFLLLVQQELHQFDALKPLHRSSPGCLQSPQARRRCHLHAPHPWRLPTAPAVSKLFLPARRRWPGEWPRHQPTAPAGG